MSDMEAILAMVENESAIQDAMDTAALILSSGGYMNDRQEKKLIIDNDEGVLPLEQVGMPSEVFCASLVQAIEQETAKVLKVREDNVLKKYIQEIDELATDCDFEITEDLTNFNRLQLIQILEALRNLHREQRKI